jgi:hypothetical protein
MLLLLKLLLLSLFPCAGALLQSTELPVMVAVVATPLLLLASASASARQICLNSSRQQHGYARGGKVQANGRCLNCFSGGGHREFFRKFTCTN